MYCQIVRVLFLCLVIAVSNNTMRKDHDMINEVYSKIFNEITINSMDDGDSGGYPKVPDTSSYTRSSSSSCNKEDCDQFLLRLKGAVEVEDFNAVKRIVSEFNDYLNSSSVKQESFDPSASTLQYLGKKK